MKDNQVSLYYHGPGESCVDKLRGGNLPPLKLLISNELLGPIVGVFPSNYMPDSNVRIVLVKDIRLMSGAVHP